MGQLRIHAPKDSSGAQLQRALESALPCDFNDWPNNMQRYRLLLNDQGGIEDDLMMVWRDASDGRTMPEVRMVVNAGNRDADLLRLKSLAPDLEFEWVDAALIALQGPEAAAVLSALDPAANDMVFMQARDLQLCGVRCFTTRSGYTGEDGYEISIPSADAERVVRSIMNDARVKPVGLGARDTLRLEAGLPLHGNDISPQVSPIEAGLGFAIAPERRLPKTDAQGQQTSPKKTGGFPGAATVLRQILEGPPRKLLGFVSHTPVPIRSHSEIVNDKGIRVGEVTSGTVSPSLGLPVMLALVQANATHEPLFAIVRDKKLKIEITKLPFVPKRYKR
jgi:aminomethyltransferase